MIGADALSPGVFLFGAICEQLVSFAYVNAHFAIHNCTWHLRHLHMGFTWDISIDPTIQDCHHPQENCVQLLEDQVPGNVLNKAKIKGTHRVKLMVGVGGRGKIKGSPPQ